MSFSRAILTKGSYAGSRGSAAPDPIGEPVLAGEAAEALEGAGDPGGDAVDLGDRLVGAATAAGDGGGGRSQAAVGGFETSRSETAEEAPGRGVAVA